MKLGSYKTSINRVARNLAQYDVQRAEAEKDGRSQEIHKAQCNAVIKTWAEVRDLTWHHAQAELRGFIQIQNAYNGSQF